MRRRGRRRRPGPRALERRLVGRLVAAAWSSHSILHTAPPDTAVVPLKRWSAGTLRDANQLARRLGVEPMPYRKPRAVPPPPSLRVVDGGKA
jgi:hypothetical protein